MDERFLDSLDAWDNLDGMLRALYSFSGCVMGAGLRCPMNLRSCRGCARSGVGQDSWVDGDHQDGASEGPRT